MLDIKATKEEIAKIHAEASAHVEKYSAVDATAEETAAQDARFAKLEKLKKNIDDAEKLARFAFSKDEPVSAKAVTVQKSPDHVAYEAAAPNALSGVTREAYSKSLSDWVRGEDEETYATISVSGNAAIVPSVVSKPLTPVKTNAYRRAAGMLSIGIESFGNTAPVTVPVITASSGGAIPDGNQTFTANDAGATIETIVLGAKGYQSKIVWYQNEFVNAQSWDVAESTLPALQGARDYGFAKAITAGIKAAVTASTITQVVTTATTTTVIIDNLDSLNQSFGMLYDSNKAIILSLTCYNLFEKLKDSQGFPLLQRNDVQGEHFLSYKGTPVLKDDTLDAMGTSGNVVGIAVSFNGFKLRDEQEKLIKYEDSETFIDQIGLNNVRYHGWGYVNEAIAVLTN